MGIAGGHVSREKTADRLLGRYDSIVCTENDWQTYAKHRKNRLHPPRLSQSRRFSTAIEDGHLDIKTESQVKK
jgi:hypothetical protein